MTLTAHAIRIHQPGPPEVMRWEEVAVPEPAPGEVRLRHTAVGLNFIDVSHRRGSYPLARLPAVIGMEGAGVIEALGDGVDGFAVGDRVSYCMVLGSYAEARTIAADRLILLPDDIGDEIAAASTLQGLTAHYLLHESYAVQAGDTVLVQAAAGGMGLLLCQWARHLGATVLGTVGSDAKAETARAHGCDHPIVYTREDFQAAVMQLTDGNGVTAVYDAIGKDTFEKGLACLAERGHMVSYGQASGPPDPVDIGPLAARALTITRGGLGVFVRDPAERARNAATLFGLIADGTLKVEINQRYPLAEAARAHADLEGRRTTGSSVLEVWGANRWQRVGSSDERGDDDRGRQTRPPFRAEHIGSLLRPKALTGAYRAAREGTLGDDELQEILDGCIREAVAMQEAAGLQAITDGEFRRGSWFLGFVDAVEGLTVAPSPFTFSGDHGAWLCPHCDGRLRRGRGITTGEFGFLREITAHTPKVTMPSPTAMHFWCGRDGVDRDAYPDLEGYFADLAAIYREELAALASLGASYVQLDEVPMAMLCDPAVRETVRTTGEDPAALTDRYVALVNAALADRPAAITVGMHLCRGNYKGQWMAEGGYGPVAESLFAGIAVDAFFLEYDSARAGGFEPLAHVPADKTVVLGLVTTKRGELESPDDLKRRIEEAAAFVPLDRLALSPQCGFASSVGGNPLSVDDERRKLELVVEVADAVWR